MKLDFFTLYITIALISFALATTWAAVSWQHKTFKPARLWLAGTIVLFIGGALLPFQHTSSTPALSAAAGNGLSILGFWLFWLGARALHTGRGGLPISLVASGACAVLAIKFFDDKAILSLIYAIGQSTPMALCLVHLLKPRNRDLGGIISALGLCIGLTGHGVVIAMNIWLIGGQEAFTDFNAIASLTMMAVVFAGVLWNFGFAVSAMHLLRDEAVELAHLDPLTGAWNRRKLDELLAIESEKCQRGGEPFALLMLDLDHFKGVNDNFGHAVGDKGLLHLVDIVQSVLRDKDVLARLGGDEFCVFLPATTAITAKRLGERIIKALAEFPLRHADKALHLSCSIGIASWSQHHGLSCNKVLSLADAALYKVKLGGRNGIALAGSPSIA